MPGEVADPAGVVAAPRREHGSSQRLLGRAASGRAGCRARRRGSARSRGFGPSVRPVCGLRAAGLPRHRPARARPGVVLLGRGVQRPVRVVEVRPAERAQVGAAGQQDRVHVVVGRDDADRDGGDADLVADRGRRTASGTTRPNAGRSSGRDLTGRHVDRVGAVRRERARRSATASSPSMPPSTQSVAEMRTRHRPVRPATPRASRRTPRAGSAAGSSSDAAVLVGALVGQRRDERRQQVAVRAVQLEQVEAGRVAALRRRRRTARVISSSSSAVSSRGTWLTPAR